jgi:all-trans-retinol dehydrogenase (NAD+)
MIRFSILVAASIVLHLAASASLRFGRSVPLSDTQLAALLWYLRWGVTLAAAIDLNAILNRWAENRWQWRNDTSGWDWKIEIAVVTGGSRGIGACVVQSLAAHGIRCAVLDVVPLSDTFTEGA